MNFDQFRRLGRKGKGAGSGQQAKGLQDNEPDFGSDYGMHVRSDRFIKTLKGWYARTRKQEDLGPFESWAEASEALEDYIRGCKRLTARHFSSPTHYGIQIHDPDTCTKALCAVCIEAKLHFIEASSSEARGKTPPTRDDDGH